MKIKIKKHVEEDTMVTLIQHFFNNEIINNKNILNINCKLWDKQKQMKTVIDDIKISYNFLQKCLIKVLKVFMKSIVLDLNLNFITTYCK